jgi:Phosphotransferase enzyme family
MEAHELTAGWLSEVLGGEVGSVAQRRIGDGLVGINLRIELVDHAPELPASVVVKLPSDDPTSRMTGVMLRNYEREVKFYLGVADTVDIRVPHCHHASWDESTGDFVIVLEDMAPAEQGDQVSGCDRARAHAAVAELARLHGPRWADPTLDDLDWLGRRTGPDDVAQLVGLWQMFFPGFGATFRSYLTDEAFALAETFGSRIGPWMDGRIGPETVTHGDYRLDNMLFATPAGGPPVTVVDWQTPGHGAPIGDLAYFCGAGLVPDDRRTHEHDLLGTYASALAGYGVDVDETWLWEQYRREAFGGVIMSVVASQIVGTNERSEAMFAAMATRHLQHALDLDSLALI